ncbi:type II secretion system protein [bacterium]|nr:type II secretion system protein [bacterium]
MKTNNANNQSGFTFIEVLLAITLFVIAAVVAVDLTRGSVRATQDLKEVTTATWLLKKTMTELEARIEAEGFDKACDKKKEGKFEAPFEKYRWVTRCHEIDFKLSQSAAAMASQDPEEQEEGSAGRPDSENDLKTASEHLSKSMRELHAEVFWIQGKKNQRSVDVTTHVARYDLPLAIPTL